MQSIAHQTVRAVSYRSLDLVALDLRGSSQCHASIHSRTTLDDREVGTITSGPWVSWVIGAFMALNGGVGFGT